MSALEFIRTPRSEINFRSGKVKIKTKQQQKFVLQQTYFPLDRRAGARWLLHIYLFNNPDLMANGQEVGSIFFNSGLLINNFGVMVLHTCYILITPYVTILLSLKPSY